MPYQIAIDGPVASGKGTVARKLARKMGLLYLDTGALYRAITVYFLDHEIDPLDPVSTLRAIKDIQVSVESIDGNLRVILNDTDVTNQLRSPIVANTVFKIAKIPEVRLKVRTIQDQISKTHNLICEGRDVTSVVFPRAEFRFYLTASAEARAQRRFVDHQRRGEDVPLVQLRADILARDHADKTRESSPLIIAPGVTVIDASSISAEEVVVRMERIVTRGLYLKTEAEIRERQNRPPVPTDVV
jgi:cytidylate kinase